MAKDTLYEVARQEGKRLRQQQEIANALREGKTVYTMNEGRWCTVTLEDGKFTFTNCNPPGHGSIITYWSL